MVRTDRSAAHEERRKYLSGGFKVVLSRRIWYRPTRRKIKDTAQQFFSAYARSMHLSVPSDPVSGEAPARIGVLGGTFDPPHIGHLVTAINLRYEMNLDLVLMVVANEPWQKVGTRTLSPAEDRLAMVQAAVQGEQGIEASDIELSRGGPSYTVDTLTSLRNDDPESELFLILGGDAAAGLRTWERPNQIAELCQIVVVDRPGSISQIPPEFTAQRIVVPRLEVSSTDLRVRAATGAPLHYLLPESVISVIAQRGLYRTEQ